MWLKIWRWIKSYKRSNYCKWLLKSKHSYLNHLMLINSFRWLSIYRRIWTLTLFTSWLKCMGLILSQTPRYLLRQLWLFRVRCWLKMLQSGLRFSRCLTSHLRKFQASFWIQQMSMWILWRKKRRKCRTHSMISSPIHVTKCLSIWKKQQTKLVRKTFSTNSLLTNKPQCSESFHNWSAPTLASPSTKS